MKDELVSFETAKLTKDKGFNWPTFDSYLKRNLRPNTLYNSYDFNNDNGLKEEFRRLVNHYCKSG